MNWLTINRIRTHGLLLAVCLWGIYAADMGTPGLLDRNGLIKGTDFLHFYTLGKIALLGRSDLLYDMRGQNELVQRFVPEAAKSYYVSLYGPQVSLLFALPAKLSYETALAIWLLLNAGIYAACCFAVWRRCPTLRNEPWTVFILAAAFPGFFHLIAWGQTSGLVLLCFTLAYLALEKKRKFLAGLTIGCLVFKPQLGIAAAVVFLLEWRIVAGAIISAATQLSVGWLHYGPAAMRQYSEALKHLRQIMPLLEPRPYQMHSVRAFWSLLLPWPQAALALYVLTGIAVLAISVMLWQREPSLQIRFAGLLLATILVAPHLTVYDLVILAPAFLFLANQVLRETGWLIYACYALFLLGPLTKFTHVQLSVPAMFALLWICYRHSDWRIATRPATLVTT
ncbi:MAG TPA: glycosyltransferase family 87 protein [Terriglobales bacterium]|nr:glycosyltransferase family 87 protein [Terriglobales bacterium]